MDQSPLTEKPESFRDLMHPDPQLARTRWQKGFAAFMLVQPLIFALLSIRQLVLHHVPSLYVIVGCVFDTAILAWCIVSIRKSLLQTGFRVHGDTAIVSLFLWYMWTIPVNPSILRDTNVFPALAMIFSVSPMIALAQMQHYRRKLKTVES